MNEATSNQPQLTTGAGAYAAPGRVNLIGEHTDYTGGFVLPMAIDFETVARISPRADRMLHLRSESFGDAPTYSLDDFPAYGRRHWSDYPAGVVKMLREAGVDVEGFDLVLSSNVPLGAGLSSSASVEVATAIAVLQRAGAMLPAAEIALLCQRAENQFVGGSCGIMDQFISVNGRRGHALMLDCRSLEFELLPLPASVSIVICNSMVKHEVAHGEYGDRRGEVEEGQAAIHAMRPEITLLRDATLADLEAARGTMSDAAFHRCRHIITENARVLKARPALESGDLRTFGELMIEAHASFRDDFAASCAEVDALVEMALTLPGCFGARITGGGFGGCTVNVVARDRAEGFREALVAGYQERFGITAECYISGAADGALARLR